MRLAGILSIILILLGGVGYLYYNHTQNIIATLTANNAQLNSAVETQQAAIDSLQNSYDASIRETRRLNSEYVEIRRQNQILTDKLENNDLTRLALERPELLERLINRGTENATRCFELLSGADLTSVERSATSANQFNSECPWLWPGNATNSLQ